MTKRILTILVATFIVASLLLGFQITLTNVLSVYGYFCLSAFMMGPLLLASYNNCRAVLRRQQLPANHTRTYIRR